MPHAGPFCSRNCAAKPRRWSVWSLIFIDPAQLRWSDPARGILKIQTGFLDFLGSHAKFCITDDERVYIGSANITQKGISGHFEMGVLLDGKPARQVSALVRALMESDFLIAYSP
ncbi:MAG: phospholipase D-like domain-containing protein [Candidatus Binatia bacterium]